MAESASDGNAAGTSDQAESKRPKCATRSSYTSLTTSRSIKNRLTGWKSGALGFSVMAFIIFFLNLAVTIWGLSSHPSNHGVLFEGDCSLVKNYNTGLHVLINIISTVLVSGSNFCMQCLSAPSRPEVDQAHTQGKWLDIGIPSLRSLSMISLRRKVLWGFLGFSSLPLHLL